MCEHVEVGLLVPLTVSISQFHTKAQSVIKHRTQSYKLDLI